MSPYLKWLIIVIAIVVLVAILAPVVLHAIQDRDFKRQVKGKQPLRQAKEEMQPPTASDAPDPILEAHKYEMLTRAKQNFLNGTKL